MTAIEPMPSGDKLARIRALFTSERVKALTNGAPLKAYVLPSTDAHQSEYLAEVDFRVKFLSGFSGSNAFVVVTEQKALLWTDGRYFEQAGKQLDSNWQLQKEGLPESITPKEWVISNLSTNDYVGFDPELMTLENGATFISDLKRMNLNGISVAGNLVDEIWTGRPESIGSKLVVLKDDETGESIESKLKSLRKLLTEKHCTAVVFAALDDIMWLLNVRGSDIPHNPLAYSYLLVTLEESHLFINESKLDESIREHLRLITVHKYGDAASWLSDWHNSNKNTPGYRVLVPSTTNYAIGNIFDGYTKGDISPAHVAKGVKNAVELAGMRWSHVRDSAALVEGLIWLEDELLAGREHTEIEVAAKIDSFRSSMDKYMDLSFSTISAAGDHAALPHYHAEGEDGKRIVTKDQVYLVDSGAHYRDGTTDVTRTVWVGDNVPKEFIHHNTLVLKGHIHLAKTKFPQGILGIRLDTLSRYALWQEGLDFGHGTGHGVGHFLNVHEGPAGIGYRVSCPGGGIKAGMVLTIEPGYYLPGKWGIRIENCYEVIPSKVSSGADHFLTFDTLTLVPIQTKIVDKTLLTQEEISWLNDYHDRVFATVGPYLRDTGKTVAHEWLRNNCKHI